MQKLQTQLKSVSKSLATLAKQVESISKQLNKAKPAKKAVKPARKAVKPAKKAAPARKPAAKKKVTPAKGKTVLDSVFEVIKRSKKGVTIAQLKTKTKLEARQLSNALYKLTKKGHIQAHSRGLYVKK